MTSPALSRPSSGEVRLLAGSMLASIPMVLFFMLQKYYIRSVASTGIKG